MKKRVLFVDDEPKVLQGLKRMLHGMRHEWKMTFVDNGAEALKILGEQRHDIVVADMRMPEMNGVQLLTEVKNLYPGIVRIVLSGYSDHELILNSVRVAHQYIAKPVNSQELSRKVNRACAMLDLLNKAPLLKVVSNMDSIPTLPRLFTQITRELEEEEPFMEKIGKMVSRDPAMTAKILQLVNSSFFSIPRLISSPAQAVNLLGLDTVKSLILTIEVFSKFDSGKLAAFKIGALWKHSIRTGTIAREICRAEDMDTKMIDDACMAGLLHDIGKLVLMDKFLDEYKQVICLSDLADISIYRAEKKIFDVSHGEVGAYLLGIWGLPDVIVESIGFHHVPEQLPDTEMSVLMAVHIANVLARVEFQKEDHGNCGINEAYCDKLGLMNRIADWKEIGREVLAREVDQDE